MYKHNRMYLVGLTLDFFFQSSRGWVVYFRKYHLHRNMGNRHLYAFPFTVLSDFGIFFNGNISTVLHGNFFHYKVFIEYFCLKILSKYLTLIHFML